ncbi:MAG: class I SAM-dependent methyltransferase [Pseudomonadota bacterium]
MAARTTDAAFWSKISRKYAADPIRDMEGYLRTLNRTKSYLKPEDHVLELGCGTGSTALQLASGVAQFTATDLSPGMIEIAREKCATEGVGNIDFSVASVMDHPFDGETYDAVLAHNLLHLVPEVDQALARIACLTKSGGVFISKTVCAPTVGSLKYVLIRRLMIPLMQALGKAPFVSFQTAETLDNSIEQAGFEIIETMDQAAVLPSRYVVARKIANGSA